MDWSGLAWWQWALLAHFAVSLAVGAYLWHRDVDQEGADEYVTLMRREVGPAFDTLPRSVKAGIYYTREFFLALLGGLGWPRWVAVELIDMWRHRGGRQE